MVSKVVSLSLLHLTLPQKHFLSLQARGMGHPAVPHIPLVTVMIRFSGFKGLWDLASVSTQP